MEKIIAAAIQFYNEETKSYIVMTGIRHADIFLDMYKLHIDYNKKLYKQGFITNHGNFVDRYAAKEIAVAAEQLIVPIEETYAELFSEDVW